MPGTSQVRKAGASDAKWGTGHRGNVPRQQSLLLCTANDKWNTSLPNVATVIKCRS